MTDVLILGGTGWLGSRIAERWLDAGASVTCLARGGRDAPYGARLVVADRDVEASDRMAVAHEALAKGRLRAALFRRSGAVDHVRLAAPSPRLSRQAGRCAGKPFDARRGAGTRGSG